MSIKSELNLWTVATFLVVAGVNYGLTKAELLAISRQVQQNQSDILDMRKDSRVTEALQRVAIIENNVVWIRADVAEIKKAVKGAQ